MRKMEDSGPIGLSLMVTMAEAYLQKLESKAIIEAELKMFWRRPFTDTLMIRMVALKLWRMPKNFKSF